MITSYDDVIVPATMYAKRFAGPVLALLLLGGIGAGVWYSNTSLREDEHRSIEAKSAAEREVSVRGLIGSEKEAFFRDPRVQSAFAKHGITVTIEKAGSRTIAHRFEPQQYDFGFPSGAPAAAQLQALAKVSETFVPFYTPIVIASWRPIAQILIANNIAQERDGTLYVTDLPALLALVEKRARWKDLQSSSTFSSNKAVLINSTDVRTSNSAAMYLALASYVANDQSVIQSQQDVDKVLPAMVDLFLRQGFQESSSAAPFEDYLALGMGKTPLLVAYESQLIAFWLEHPDRIKDDMVMLYPVPTVYSKHVFVPFNAKARRVGEALENDEQLQALAHEYGFRTGGARKGPELWATKGIQTPAVLVDVVDPPSHEWLERMITAIEQRFK